jgi:hypothetical protein
MAVFRLFLVAAWISLTAYTAVVAANHGLGLVPIFFHDISALNWPGQFNLDFLIMLLFSALWVAWRNAYSPFGLGLAVLALVGGSLFLSTYLLILSLTSQGNLRQVLLGEQRGA